VEEVERKMKIFLTADEMKMEIFLTADFTDGHR
jgi:hypothetical protein